MTPEVAQRAWRSDATVACDVGPSTNQRDGEPAMAKRS